jgi:hypothetical protein
MPQKGLQALTIQNFEGVRNWESPQRISPRNLWYAQNCIIEGGRLRSAKGVSAYLDELTGGTNIKGLMYFPFRSSGTTMKYILELYNGQWYKVDTSTDSREAIVGATTHVSDEDATGIVINNVAYLSNATDGMAWWDGTTWSTTFEGASVPPKATIMAENAGKMWAVDPAAPNIVVYSRTANAANPEYIRDWVTGSGRALITHSGYITAMINLKKTLYVFTNQSVSVLTGFDTSATYPIPIFEPYSVSAGAINSQCAVVVENDILFLTPNLEIRSLGSAENFDNDPRTEDISKAFKRYLRELDPDQSGACMTYFNKVVKLSMKTIGSPSNNWTMEYNLNDKTFSIRRVSSVKQYVHTDTQLYFSTDADETGQLYKEDVGYSNNGNSFRFSAKTFMSDLGRPDIQKRARYINVYLGRSLNQVTYLSVYKNSYDTVPVYTFTLHAPTSAELGSPPGMDGAWGDGVVGDCVWGGEGESISATDEPRLFFKNFKIDTNSFGTMYGFEVFANIEGGMVEVQQIIPMFIPLPQTNQVVDI